MGNNPLWLLLVVIVVSLPPSILSMNKKPPPEIKEYPGFGRECVNGESCTFSPGGVENGTLYFSCKPSTSDKAHSFCFCGTGSLPRDELMFPLEWDGDAERCVVGRGAPCGSDQGLNVHCRNNDKDLECVQGRCRNPDSLHSGDVSIFCYDDLDCKNGLECRESETPTMVKIKRCYHHKTE